MESKYIASLERFSDEVRQCEVPPPKKCYLEALENYGRERLSEHFFMRDFMYSEISAVHGIPNIPDDPELAIKAGRGLCVNLLEPLRDIFGHVVIRSAFRSTKVNGYGNEHDMSCSMNEKNFAKHIWDVPDKGDIGATACIVIPWFSYSERFLENSDWRPLALFIHDNLPYSEMRFFSRNAAFNLTWKEKTPRRKIYGLPDIREGDHSEAYSWFPSS